MSRGNGVNYHAMPVHAIVKVLTDHKGCKLIDPSELSNATLDQYISQGKKLLVVEGVK
jgi:hypothetical protein